MSSIRLADFVGESALLLGAGSAVMYQLALAPVGQGVASYSTTLDRPADRLRTTLTYVYVQVLGTEHEREAVVGMVNRMHGPVGPAAFDPSLQLWVAATLAHNAEVLYERVFGALSEADREQVYRDAQILGTALQVPFSAWPLDRGAFGEYWNSGLGRLSASPSVRAYAARLLQPAGPVWLRLLLPLQSLMTRGLLDSRTRSVLDLPWSARDQRRFDLFWRVFPPVYRRVPRVIRQLPARWVLRDFRRRLAAGRRVI